MKQGSWAVYVVLGGCSLVSAFHFSPVRQDTPLRAPMREGAEDIRPQRDLDAEVDAQIQWLHDALHPQDSSMAREDRPATQTGTSETKRRARREI